MKNLCSFLSFALLTMYVQAQVGIGTTSPNSMLDLRGSFAPVYRSFTGATSLTTNDFTVVFTGSSATTATLPDATTCPGRIYCIKNFSATLPAPVLTINTIFSQMIDGAADWVLNASNATITVISDGTNWEMFNQYVPSSTGSSWNLGGNSVAGATPLGTLTAFDLPFITNNTEKMRITSAGNVGIGSTVFSASPEALLVYQNSSTSFNVIGGKGSLNNYLQLNIQNQNSGSSASSDLVATADNGNETTNYVDLGMNSSTYSAGSITGGADNAYLYSAANDFIIGNSTAAKNLIFFTGGTAVTNEAMRINGTGYVGIGTTSPAYKLQVNAATNPLYLGGVQTGLSTDSILTIVNGVVRKLLPSSLVTSSTNAWSLVGNNNTLASNYFIGTTNTDPLIIKIDGQPAGRIDLVNTFLGFNAGYNSNAANQNTGIGYHSLFSVTGGTNNTAIGYNTLPNLVSGSYNIGVGYSTDGGNNVTNTIGLGVSTYITGSYSTAIGSSAQVQINNGLAIGHSAYVDHAYSLAIGESAQSQGTAAVVIGQNAYSNGTNAIAIGGTSVTPGTEALNTNALAIGNVAYAGGASSVAIGDNAKANNTNSVALGYKAATNQNNSIVLGDITNNSLNVGIGTNTPGAKLHIYAASGNNPLILQGVPAGSGSDNILTINPITGVVDVLPVSSLTAGWNTLGNAGTSSGTDFLGTTDFKSLSFRTNNIQHAILDSTGNMGIGTGVVFNAAAPEKLLVNAGTTGSFNAVVAKGSVNNYFQLNINNQSSGSNASSDVVATADNGNETTNYVDLGINSSTNSANVMGAPDDSYLYTTGNNFLIGTGTAAKSLVFMTGGTTQSTNERMRIDGNGNVGIGTNAPTSNLTLYQSAGVTSEGFRFTGNSIGGTNSGTGFAMALGYNVPNNKQLWLGDADYLGNPAGTFVRYSTTNGATILDAISGDNSVRKTIAIAVGGDPLSDIILGSDGNATAPGSYVWANGNMAIGNGYRGNSAPSNGLLVQGNVGIGTNAPATALAVAGTNPLTLLGVQTGTNTSADSVLTITSGLVRKLPLSTFATTTGNWSTAGNTGTSSGTDFLGTTDLKSLSFRTNNIQHAILDSTGNMGIGTGVVFNAAAPEKLLVNAGTTGSFNAVVAKGSVNNYFQLNINNQSSGSNASSDVVATADNGNETTNYVDLGINSSTNSANVMGAADDAYLYTTGNNFLIGTGTAAKSLVFMTGGTTQSTNERMRIDGNGNVGIGTPAPNSLLDVTGSAGYAITTTGSNITLDATNYTVIITGGTPSITLPVAAAANARRIYVIVNQTGASRTISTYKNFSGVNTTTITTASSITVQSDGTNWYRIQ